MSQNVVFNGAVYTIPDVGEEDWGQNLTDYFVAIASSTLQKTGGAFDLTADADFGANFGLAAQFYRSRSTNRATAGNMRFARTDSISWRNNANAANLLLTVDGSDQLTFNGTAISGNNVTLSAVGAVPNANGATLTGQVLNLEPADASFPGVVTTAAQTFAGNKTFTGATGLLQTAAAIDVLLQSDIKALGSYLTDTTVTSVQPAGVWNTVIGSVVSSTAQAAGQTRGVLRVNLSLTPTAGTVYGGNYRGMQFTSSNVSASVTGTMTAGTFNTTTLTGATTVRQVGGLFTVVNFSGIIQQATSVDASTAHATGTDTVAHAAVGVRIGNSAVTASGSSVSNTATGLEIRNNITATGTAATAYAINSLSTAQSVFAGTLTASRLSATPVLFTGTASGTVIASATDVAISWTEVRDTDTMFTSGSTITTTTAGYYDIDVALFSQTTAIAANDALSVIVQQNGTPIDRQYTPMATGSNQFGRLAGTYLFAAGDAITIVARQDSGTSITLHTAGNSVAIRRLN